jgi:hypothetical protein
LDHQVEQRQREGKKGEIWIITLKKGGERERRKEIWIVKLRKGGEREMRGKPFNFCGPSDAEPTFILVLN